jgi:hypothetical protein
MSRGNGTAIVLALVAAGCAAALDQQLGEPAERPLAAATPAVPTLSLPALEEPALVVPPLAAYAPVVERPLFSPTRRPPVAAAPSPAVAPARGGELTLRGVVLSPHKRIALIETEGAPEPRWLAEGETLQGWTVEEVHAGHIVLSDAGATRQLALRWEATPGSVTRRARSTPPPRPREEAPAAAPTRSESRLANAIRMLKTATYGNRLAR